jgi:hypothetical protein
MKKRNKGLYGFCPVWVEGLQEEHITIYERHPLLKPLFILSHYMVVATIYVMSAMNPNYEPKFPIKIYLDKEEQ